MQALQVNIYAFVPVFISAGNEEMKCVVKVEIKVSMNDDAMPLLPIKMTLNE